MTQNNIIYKVWQFYADGFRNMTVGKTLWTLIIIKLIVIFLILKWLFFPNYVHQNADKGEEAKFVASEVLGNTQPEKITDH